MRRSDKRPKALGATVLLFLYEWVVCNSLHPAPLHSAVDATVAERQICAF
jgi:hypothetical protein